MVEQQNGAKDTNSEGIEPISSAFRATILPLH